MGPESIPQVPLSESEDGGKQEISVALPVTEDMERVTVSEKDSVAFLLEQKPEIPRDVEIFSHIKEETASDPELGQLFRGMQSAVMRYAEIVNAHSHFYAKQRIFDEADRDRAMELDQRRHFAHESMMDSLNALSRACAKAGIDNSWRNDVGLERDKIGMWSLVVADHLKREALSQAGLRKEGGQ
jgi:hypothetical protein